MTTRNPAAAYRSTAVETRVHEADPHQLIALMLEGAIQRLRMAEACIASGDFTRKAKAASEAGAIVDSLSGCLDFSQGGAIAARLEALYDYASRRIVAANAANDAEGFGEVAGLLDDVFAAWKQIKPA
ncbi:flagellar export chaperone FliS [Silanimonas sp.]|uniref:flagellar export chaperone FliS n=1 Tax=Silanimonas sp. TaxID=1929290 RepID=UPI0022CAD1D7|nr:flagellar export chaperone FliS [Silanimonas sp.]MCZ8166431.1 flagellar export chaperone FliS [Silanimonas sp.]